MWSAQAGVLWIWAAWRRLVAAFTFPGFLFCQAAARAAILSLFAALYATSFSLLAALYAALYATILPLFLMCRAAARAAILSLFAALYATSFSLLAALYAALYATILPLFAALYMASYAAFFSTGFSGSSVMPKPSPEARASSLVTLVHLACGDNFGWAAIRVNRLIHLACGLACVRQDGVVDVPAL